MLSNPYPFPYPIHLFSAIPISSILSCVFPSHPTPSQHPHVFSILSANNLIHITQPYAKYLAIKVNKKATGAQTQPVFPLALVQAACRSWDTSVGRGQIGETRSSQMWAQNLSWVGPKRVPVGFARAVSEMSPHPLNKMRLMRLKFLVQAVAEDPVW